jgi:hypothetical protein
MEKEEYVKPSIEVKEIELGVYGTGGYCATCSSTKWW